MTNNQAELWKWNDLFQENTIFKKEIKKLEKCNLHDIGFYNKPKVLDNKIFGFYGIGYNKINAITVKGIIDIFVDLVGNENNEQILLSSDGSKETNEIIKKIIDLNHKNLKLLCYSNFEGFDKKFISVNIKKIQPKASIHISKSIFNTKMIDIILYDSNGMKIKNEILQGIVSHIDHKIFDYKKPITSLVSFLNNDYLIKIFVERISNLFRKTTNTRKTKIAISNRSEGITKILSKLVGSHDFSYTINNKLKNKDINILDKDLLNDKNIKMYFKKDIIYAMRKKANILICFNREGTQLFLFLIHGKKIFYLNQNLISLIFLHNFFNDLELEHKKLDNIYISSNEIPDDNMTNLLKKYKVDFRKNKSNVFLNNDYLLLFWNDYNQNVFGEKINDEFTIYHLLIKIISIIDYYISQYNSPLAMFNKMIKIYGETVIQEKFSYKCSEEEANEKIKKFLADEKLSKTIIEKKKIEKHFDNVIDNDLWEFKTNNNYKISIKYNCVMNKVIVVFNYTKITNIIKRFFVSSFERKKLFKNIFKN